MGAGDREQSGFINYYWNGALVRSQTYTQFTSADAGLVPSASTPWAFGVLDGQHITLLFGSNNKFPITVGNVQVWQANASQNMVH